MRKNWLSCPILLRRCLCTCRASGFSGSGTLISKFSPIPAANSSNFKFNVSKSPLFLPPGRMFYSVAEEGGTFYSEAEAEASLSGLEPDFVIYSDLMVPAFVGLSTEEGFRKAFRKALQANSLPSIFFFTSNWSGPCHRITRKLARLMSAYSHVTTYDIDVDKDGIGFLERLSDLGIASVPTLHFYRNGKKEAEVIGLEALDLEHLRGVVQGLFSNFPRKRCLFIRLA